MDSEKIADKYNKMAVEYADSRVGKEDKGAIEKFTALLEKQSKVLDVGCAAGRDSRIFKDLGFEVVGVDLSTELIKIAQQRNPGIEFIVSDISDLSFNEGSFDGIWASAVLHHLPLGEMRVAIEGFSKVLKPGGILYVRTKTNGKVVTQSIGNIDDRNDKDFVLVSKDQLEGMVKLAAFEILEINNQASKTREGLVWLSGLFRKVT